MEHRISQLDSGIHKGKYVFETKQMGEWSPVTMPCKTEKTCRDRRTRWLGERERERTRGIADQVMAKLWKDVYIPVMF